MVDSAGLGIQRLSIIDLSTGDQPIFNEDRSVVVVLNGEIYNFPELRERLLRSGHRFSTNSDTEVIVHLYEELGVDCVKELNGMFAFALWDRKRQRLFVARDRLGKKPLVYWHRDGALSFASELRALLQDPEVPRNVDHVALDAYVAYRWVPAPLTAFKAIRKLPPGSYMTFEQGKLDIQRYWSLDFGSKRTDLEGPALNEEIRDQIRSATRRRMIADVPLGAFLSGGVDSSAVVAAMAEASSEPVKTFSIGFTSEEYDELPRARLIADRFSTDHHEFVVEPHAIEMLPKIVAHYGEPFADASAVPSFYVAEMARRHVTVALNGDGGDESFAGYTRYVSNLALARADALPRLLRQAAGHLLEAVPASGRIDSTRSRLRRMGTGLQLDAANRYVAYMTRLNGLDRAQLYTDDYRALVGDSDPDAFMTSVWHAGTATSTLDHMLEVDTHTYLVDDLLTKMDIASMAYSLEARSPLLDYQFMEFAASLPPNQKLRGRQKKYALREALRGWIPDEILDGRKRGFRSPIADWFRGELREFAREVLLDGAARDRGYFREPYVRGLLDAHAAGEADHSQGIWTLVNFELWHRQFVDETRDSLDGFAVS